MQQGIERSLRATSQCSFFVSKTKQRKELNIFDKEQKFE